MANSIFIKNEFGYLVSRNTGEPLHRIRYEKRYGVIPPKWDIHHVDGNKLNNDTDNLIALPHRVHFAIHEFFGKDLPTRDECCQIYESRKNLEQFLDQFVLIKLSGRTTRSSGREPILTYNRNVGREPVHKRKRRWR